MMVISQVDLISQVVKSTSQKIHRCQLRRSFATGSCGLVGLCRTQLVAFGVTFLYSNCFLNVIFHNKLEVLRGLEGFFFFSL